MSDDNVVGFPGAGRDESQSELDASLDAASDVTEQILKIMNRPDAAEMYRAFGLALTQVPPHLVPAATEALKKIAEGE